MSEQNFTISPKGVTKRTSETKLKIVSLYAKLSKILRVAPLKSYKVKHRNAVRMTEPVCGVYVAEQLNGAEEAAVANFRTE